MLARHAQVRTPLISPVQIQVDALHGEEGTGDVVDHSLRHVALVTLAPCGLRTRVDGQHRRREEFWCSRHSLGEPARRRDQAAQSSPAQHSLAQHNTAQPIPSQPSPVQPAKPSPASPAQPSAAQPSPAQPNTASPAQHRLAQPSPVQPSPAQSSPLQPSPAQPNPA